MGRTPKGKDQVAVANGGAQNAAAAGKVREGTPVSVDTAMSNDQAREGSAPASSSGRPDIPGTPNLSGIVSNDAPITEEEAEQVLAPEALFEEEERLRHERVEADPQVAADAAQAVLSQAKFDQLDNLLSKADMYTNFLTEQMAAIRNQTQGAGAVAEAVHQKEAAAAQPAGKGKRKGAGKAAGGRGAKRQKGASGRAAAASTSAGEGSSGDDHGKTATQKLLPLMAGELRDYQLQGVQWMISLYQNGLSGILADQMGLGKTVQTIGFLSHLWSHGIHGPFLIVGPLSTLSHWVSEVKRWCPTMPVVLYHGSRDERAAIRAKDMQNPGSSGFPVIVTSYEVVMADIKPLSKFHYKYIVVDEGHRLKNFECRLLRELRLLSTDMKLLLTGTPLQNNLSELWSLLNFLLPDIFNSVVDFESWFDFGPVVGAGKGSAGDDLEAMATEQRSKVLNKLHGILRPFLLRRMKADVEIALPRKQEIVLYAPMSDLQKKLNQQLLEKTLTAEMAKVAEQGGGQTSALGKLNNVLMQMRKNCNHPDLITAPFTGELDYPTPQEMVQQCGKMALLERLLDQLRARGHKVLIFSQMTKMLDLIESYLEQRGTRACRIDGSIPWQTRQANITDFNSNDPDTWVFLLSTRAGGLGINLTAADTVIIYDSDWNPQQDLQAMDRCHRIGQQKPVLVFRLATAHSVEGKMLKRANEKMALERVVIKKGVFKELLDQQVGKAEEGAKGSSSSSMNAAELLELLRSDVAHDGGQQSGAVDDAMLDKLLDRNHLELDKKTAALPYPASGKGYEVVAASDGGGLLSSVQ